MLTGNIRHWKTQSFMVGYADNLMYLMGHLEKIYSRYLQSHLGSGAYGFLKGHIGRHQCYKSGCPMTDFALRL